MVNKHTQVTSTKISPKHKHTDEVETALSMKVVPAHAASMNVSNVVKTKQLEINRTIWVTGILAATIDVRPREWRWTLKCFHIYTNWPCEYTTWPSCDMQTVCHTHTHIHTLSLSYTCTHTHTHTHVHNRVKPRGRELTTAKVFFWNQTLCVNTTAGVSK